MTDLLLLQETEIKISNARLFLGIEMKIASVIISFSQFQVQKSIRIIHKFSLSVFCELDKLFKDYSKRLQGNVINFFRFSFSFLFSSLKRFYVNNFEHNLLEHLLVYLVDTTSKKPKLQQFLSWYLYVLYKFLNGACTLAKIKK